MTESLGAVSHWWARGCLSGSGTSRIVIDLGMAAIDERRHNEPRIDDEGYRRSASRWPSMVSAESVLPVRSLRQ